MDSNHSKPNLNHLSEIGSIRKSSKHLKGILIIRMRIRTTQTRFRGIFKPFRRDSKHTNANLNHSKMILSIRMQIRGIEKDSNHSNANSNISNEILTIRM